MRSFSFIKIVILSGFVSTMTAGTGYALEGGTQVAEGVVYYHDVQTSGPLSWHVLEMDYPSKDYEVKTAAANGNLFQGDTVENIVENRSDKNEIIAGMNGGYWGNGAQYVPTGLLISDGYLLRLPLDNRSAFLIDGNQKFYAGPVNIDITLSSGKSKLSVKNLNSLSATRDTTLYTPQFGTAVKESTHTLHYYRLSPLKDIRFLPNEPVSVKISEVKKEELALTDGSFILAVPSGEKKPALGTGTLKAEIKEFPGTITHGVSGGPSLIHNGKFDMAYEKGRFASAFITSRHPRTAIGYSKSAKKLYWVVVDGRQKNLSIGVNMKELSDYMIGLGCDAALNLDGGGSSTFFLNGKMKNSPSDLNGARKVANGVFLVKKSAKNAK